MCSMSGAFVSYWLFKPTSILLHVVMCILGFGIYIIGLNKIKKVD